MPVDETGRMIRAYDEPAFRIRSRRHADEVKEMQDVDTVAESPTARIHEGYRLSLESEPRRIRAVFRGETIADSSTVLVMHETRLTPGYYFPRGDVRMDFLAKSERTTHCPFTHRLNSSNRM